jgi:UDP-N-acetylmuramoyl-L-alanyl-D-glutamate--2,6-diaminopimelate ligase
VIQGVPGIVRKSPDDVLVSGVAYDSRDVSPGNIFVALKGAVVDGHNFIQDAIQRGAAAVVGTQAISELPVPYIQVEDSRQSLAFISAALFQYPARQLVVIAVTGTDGKTTTANLIFKILRAANVRVGMITTVNAVIVGSNISRPGTTQGDSDGCRYRCANKYYSRAPGLPWFI